MREAGKKKKETQLPHLWNPHKIKKSDKMKLRYKISIWVALALAGSLLWGGSVWLWLAGKFLFRLLLTIALAIAVYILTCALIIGGILWLHRIGNGFDFTSKILEKCILRPYFVIFTRILKSQFVT